MDYFTSSHLYVQKGVKRTPAGLTFMSEWGSLRHAAGVAAIIAFYSRSVRVRDSLGGRKRADEMLDFAESQVSFSRGSGHAGAAYLLSDWSAVAIVTVWRNCYSHWASRASQPYTLAHRLRGARVAACFQKACVQPGVDITSACRMSRRRILSRSKMVPIAHRGSR